MYGSPRTHNGLGFDQQLVKVSELLPDQYIARCMNPQTREQYSVSTTQRSHASWPQVGEYWVITRSISGLWDFTIKINPPSAPNIVAPTTASVLNQAITGLVSEGLLTDGRTTPAWTPLTMTGTWTGTPSVYLQDNGLLRFRGTVATSGSVSSGSTIATIPNTVGVLPHYTDTYPTTYTIGTTPAAGGVTVDTSGNVKYVGATGTIASLYLGGITVPALF